MQRTVFRAVIAICTGLIGFTSGGCDGGSDDPGVHTSGRPWVKEQEFRDDPLLHATPDQTVILDLPPAPTRAVSTVQRKTFPYLVRDVDQGSFSFCIPTGASELNVIELESDSGSTVFRSERGGACPPIELRSGRYHLHLDYDTASVAPGGTTAFFYRPEQPRVLDSAEASAPSWNFFTFKAPDGNYVGLANPESNPGAVAAIYEAVAPQTIFLTGNLGIMGSSTCTPDTPSIAPFADTPVAGLAWFPSKEAATLIPDSELLSIDIGASATDVTNACTAASDHNDFGGCVITPSIQDLGSYRINLFNEDRCITGVTGWPIYLDAFNVVRLQPNTQNSATEFTVDYTGTLCSGGTCSSADLDLQQGEVAVFAECGFKGPAIVFAADVPDFSVYNDAPTDPTAGFVYGIKDNTAASIMIGPGTFVELWTHTGGASGNTLYGVPQNTDCLSGTPVDGQVSQMKIVSATTYIADTGGCVNCNLTGVDLSGENYASLNFTNAIFSGANLSDTKFTSAKLANASLAGTGIQLSGTDFTDAGLACADFSGLDLTGATFGGSSQDLGTNFDCRLNLASATFDFSDFPIADWRYLEMTGSTVNNVPDTLSSSSAPVDLSGAMLGGVTWLESKSLDFVNLGCFAGTSASGAVCPAQGANTAVCTTLTGTVLTSASLTNSCLDTVSLQGAFLNFANLDASDLTNASLQAKTNGVPARLAGAFLRDATLAGANLTGVTMTNANFFQGSGSASAAGATMTAANLSGAYLAGADFGDATLQGTTWTGAVLVGANFNGADLSQDPSTTATSTFDGAYMEGSVFVAANTNVADVNFLNTYWDLSGDSVSLNFLLPAKNLAFAGYWGDPSDPECVQASYPNSVFPTSGPPTTTDADNTCPNGDPGSCDAVWENPVVPIGQATPPSAVNPALPGTCTEVDILWQFGS